MSKLSGIINYPLGWLGLELKRKVSGKENEPEIPHDILADRKFVEIYNKTKAFSMVDVERAFALYNAVRYIIQNNIAGDLVECGVWRGGSCMLMAYTLKDAGDTSRKIWLYDTFAGMVKPGIHDGDTELLEWEKRKISDDKNDWCLAGIDEVKENLKKTGYPFENINTVIGKVEQTIPGTIPGKIALLRLDTDWYDSTKHELEHLYPLMEPRGVLIIDDYGTWQGARKATDEYFKGKGSVFLNRVDATARLVIK